jgi:thioester reductase-like protein
MPRAVYTSLVNLLEKKAEQKPDFVLYTFLQGSQNERILSYQGLAEQAKKIAIVLQKVTHPGDRVLILYPPGLDFIAAFWGCLYAGVIAVPAYPPSTKELFAKVHYIIKSATARVVLTNDGIFQHIKRCRTAKWLSPNSFVHRITNEIINPLMLQNALSPLVDFEKILFISTDELPEQMSEWIRPALGQDHIAFLQYTSGSTGKPKGVMISHGNLLHNLLAIEKINQIKEDDVCISWLPPYHDMGLIGGILQPLFSTFSVKLMSPLTFMQRPAVWLEMISHYHATGTVAPNFAYDLCASKVSEEEKSQLDLRSLNVVMTGAEPIRKMTIDRFSACFAPCGFQAKAFFPCYGLAESTLMVTGVCRNEGLNSQWIDRKALSEGTVVAVEEADPNARCLINCGRPIDGVHLAIVQPVTLKECPERMIGEIWVASDSVAQGYWKLPAETKHYFNVRLGKHEHSFLRTGDLGYLDKGSLYVTGRLKDIIIIRGCNYYPHDLEHIIDACHPHLRPNGCAVFAIEEYDRELLVIVQEIREEVKSINSDELVNCIRSTLLSEEGIVADVVILAGRKSVPKTTSGKTQRVLCKKRYLEGTLEIIHQDKVCAHELIGTSLLSTEKDVDADCFNVTQILQRILNVEDTLEDESKLSQLGLSSVHLGELHQALSTSTDAKVPFEFLLMDPRLKEIKCLLAGEMDVRQLAISHIVALDLEFNKYKNIPTDIKSLPKPVPQRALLTGATGFLGAYLLHELLVNTSWHITCLVQADSIDAGLKRISQNMQKYGLWSPLYHERIKPVVGNLEKIRLGLSRHDWDILANDMDLIFHSAAQLNFIAPYQRLAASNVLGTIQLLELAGYKHLKAFHYVSTLGYFMSADLADDFVVCEQSKLRPEQGIYGGYNQTKWLAECLVLHARRLNIPTIIYRPSLIVGDSKTGFWNEADVVCRILKGCIQLGARPILDVDLNLVPVDYVAKAIACFATENPYQIDSYHLMNPQAVSLEQLCAEIRAKGFNVDDVAYSSWEEMIKERSDSDLAGSFTALRPFFTEKVSNKDSSLFNLYLRNNKAKIDSSYTRVKLAERGIHCDQIDELLIHRYLDYLINCGYLTQQATKE